MFHTKVIGFQSIKWPFDLRSELKGGALKVNFKIFNGNFYF